MKKISKTTFTLTILLTILAANVAFSSVAYVKADALPVIGLNPSKITLTEVGQTFQVNITISNVQNLYQWETNVTWDPTVLALEGRPTEGDFFSSQDLGETLFLAADARNGSIPGMASALMQMSTGASGSGTVATLTFRALKVTVESPINLKPEDTHLSAPEVDTTSPTEAKLIAHEVQTPALVTLISGDAPIAEAGQPQTVNEGTTVTFNGSKSIALSGNLTYVWVFSDNGTKTLNGDCPTYQFDCPGEFVVTLTVKTADNKQGSDNTTITVLDITPPVAMLSLSESSATGRIYAGQNVGFTGSASFDPEGGDIGSYHWDYGDGNASDTKEANYVFPQAGVYTVSLTVRDTRANLTDTDRMRFTVEDSSTNVIQQGQGFTLPPTIVAVLLFITVVVIGGSAFWLLGITTKTFSKKKQPPNPNS